MKLPNREKPYIEPEKTLPYLLNESHKVGWAKAKYLRAAGFNESNVRLLEQHLLNLAKNGEVSEQESTLHGEKFVIPGHSLRQT